MLRKDKAIKFFRLARFYALEFSKDTSTQVGCVLLNPRNAALLSMGYNGMPPGCDDNKPERLERPEKYFWFEHAERNAIYTAADEGVKLSGCIAVVTMMPCMDCARALARIGCVEVITHLPTGELFERWKETFSRTLELFQEKNIELTVLSTEDISCQSQAFSRNLAEGWQPQLTNNKSLVR